MGTQSSSELLARCSCSKASVQFQDGLEVTVGRVEVFSTQTLGLLSTSYLD